MTGNLPFPNLIYNLLTFPSYSHLPLCLCLPIFPKLKVLLGISHSLLGTTLLINAVSPPGSCSLCLFIPKHLIQHVENFFRLEPC